MALAIAATLEKEIVDILDTLAIALAATAVILVIVVIRVTLDLVATLHIRATLE